MLRLLSSKAQGHKDFFKPSKSCHVGIHWKDLTGHSQMSTNVHGFYRLFSFVYHFLLEKLYTSTTEAMSPGNDCTWNSSTFGIVM